MNDEELKKLVDEVAAASGYSGLDMGTMYGKFAFDVAQRAVLAEREACAKVCEKPINIAGTNVVANKFADAIRMRSNAI